MEIDFEKPGFPRKEASFFTLKSPKRGFSMENDFEKPGFPRKEAIIITLKGKK
jgi:hypothetical protein